MIFQTANFLIDLLTTFFFHLLTTFRSTKYIRSDLVSMATDKNGWLRFPLGDYQDDSSNIQHNLLIDIMVRLISSDGVTFDVGKYSYSELSVMQMLLAH